VKSPSDGYLRFRDVARVCGAGFLARGLEVVPPLALKTAASVAAFFSSVTNCSPPGVASSRCMNDHT